MATENKGVMVYLPKEVEEYITEFCTEYSITRKDKEGNILPSLGTGIVTYLKSKISGESPDDILTKPSKSPSNGLSKEEVLDLVNEYLTSHSLSNGLSKDEVLDLIEQSVTNNHSPQSIGARDIEVALEPITVSVSEAKDYARSQIEKVSEDLIALSDRLDNLESISTNQPTTPTTDPTPTPQQPATKTRQPRKSSEIVPPTLEAVIDMTIDSISWGQFMRLVGLDPDEPKKASNADLALEIAAGLGVPVSPKGSSKVGYYFTANKAFNVRRP